MRLLSPALLTTLLTTVATSALVVGTTTPASAAWRTTTTVHGAKLQICKAFVQGDPVLRLRLDNRQGRHAHRGGVFNETTGASRSVTVRAGRISATRQLPVKGRTYTSFVGEVDGPSAGGGLSPSEAPRCSA